MTQLSPVDSAAFRDVMGRFATGVTVVTARDGTEDLALTVSSLVSVSLAPLQVLVCIARELPMHGAVAVGRPWGVSVLSADQERVSRSFATRKAGAEELARHDLVSGPATGLPLLADAVARLECVTTAVHDGGDHDVVLGQVRSLAVRDDSDQPLIFFRGGYRSLR